MEINASIIRSTARKSVEYMPTMKLRDNKRIGYSYDSTGATQAKGTLYPFNMNSNTNIGAPSTMYSGEHTGLTDYDLDYDSYTDNEVKYKTAESYFQNYRKLKSISIGFVQQELTLATNSLYGTSGMIVVKKTYAVSSTTFVVIFTQTSTAGTYAVVGTVNATTGAITFGTSVSLSTVVATYLNIDFAEISTAKYVVCFGQTATTMRNVVFTVSGTTITAGTAVDKTITTTTTVGNFNGLKVVKEDTDKYICTWGNGNNTNTYAYVATVSGTVPTIGSETDIFASTNRNYPDVAFASTSSGAFIAYDNNLDLRVVGFTVSGTTLTLGTVIIAITGTENLGSSNYIFKGLANGLMYYFNGDSSGSRDPYYFALSGTTVSIRFIDADLTVPTVAGTWTREWTISANAWAYAISVSSTMYLLTFSYDSSTGKVNMVRRDFLSTDLEANSLDTARVLIGNCGSQFFVLAGATTNSTDIYNITFEAGSCEVYFEAEGTACATLTNATYGWAYTRQAVNKLIKRNIAYFSLKNKCGHTAFIKTQDWMFEVD